MWRVQVDNETLVTGLDLAQAKAILQALATLTGQVVSLVFDPTYA